MNGVDARLEGHKAGICDWLTANGIPPDDVPVRVRPVITGGQILVEVMHRNENGRRYFTADGDLATGLAVAPLVVPLPDSLAWWPAAVSR